MMCHVTSCYSEILYMPTLYFIIDMHAPRSKLITKMEESISTAATSIKIITKLLKTNKMRF